MNEKVKDTFGFSLVIILILLIVSLFTLMPILNMIILGAVIAYGLKPISDKIQTKAKYPSISIILSIIFVVIPIILIFGYAVFVTIDLSYSFISSHQDKLNYLNLNQTIVVINSFIPPEMELSAGPITTSISEMVNDLLKMTFGYLVKFIQSLPLLMLQIFVLLFSIFYFARDGHNIKKYVDSFIPNEKHEFYENMIKEVKLVLKSIFYGHFLTAFIIGAIAGVGFFILGYPYAILLGIMTGVFELIPVTGPWVVYTVLIISDLLSGNYIRAILVLIFGFGLSMSDMYIRPALTGKYINIHPLILLLGFLAGPIVFGLVGLILGPLILGITFAIVKAYKEEREKTNLEKVEKNEKSSNLG